METLKLVSSLIPLPTEVYLWLIVGALAVTQWASLKIRVESLKRRIEEKDDAIATLNQRVLYAQETAPDKLRQRAEEEGRILEDAIKSLQEKIIELNEKLAGENDVREREAILEAARQKLTDSLEVMTKAKEAAEQRNIGYQKLLQEKDQEKAELAIALNAAQEAQDEVARQGIQFRVAETEKPIITIAESLGIDYMPIGNVASNFAADSSPYSFEKPREGWGNAFGGLLAALGPAPTKKREPKE